MKIKKWHVNHPGVPWLPPQPSAANINIMNEPSGPSTWLPPEPRTLPPTVIGTQPSLRGPGTSEWRVQETLGAINPGDNWIPYGIFVWKSDSTPILGTFTSATFFWCEFFFENENSGNSQIAATILAPPGVAIAQMRWTFAWASLWMTRCWQKASDWYSWQEPDLPYSFILIFQGPTNWVSYLLCEPFP